jgi:hypothetical protein
MSQQEFTDFEIELNLEATEAWNGESAPLLDPGDYNLTVVGFEQKTGKDSNQPYIAVTFEVADGELAGRKVWNNYSLSQKAVGRLKSLMLACKTELTKVVASQFMGQTIRASVVHEDMPASVDTNGNPRPAKPSAKVINEQPLEEAPVETKPATKAPPITNKPATKPVNNGQARRA